MEMFFNREVIWRDCVMFCKLGRVCVCYVLKDWGCCGGECVIFVDGFFCVFFCGVFIFIKDVIVLWRG